MINIFNDPFYLPIIFAALMYIAGLAYAILDGYDLGVGILLNNGNEEEKDRMIASIGPFWDANETWLVLTVGILLVAFPYAQGIVLSSLYAPLVTMLISLVVRGVAFEFRIKVQAEYKRYWNNAFFAGSLLTALSQGYMLAIYMMGFDTSAKAMLLALVVAITLTAGYTLIGASWLIIKTEGELQKKAVCWAKKTIIVFFPLMVAILVAYFANNKRLVPAEASAHKDIALITLAAVILIIMCLNYYTLTKLPMKNDDYCWAPFVATAIVFVCCIAGLGYDLYPYIVPKSMTIWNAASSKESLQIILAGALGVLPLIIIYNIVIHKVFWGKAKDLRY